MPVFLRIVALVVGTDGAGFGPRCLFEGLPSSSSLPELESMYTFAGLVGAGDVEVDVESSTASFATAHASSALGTFIEGFK